MEGGREGAEWWTPGVDHISDHAAASSPDVRRPSGREEA